mgnify:CR=1 FL=1
MGPCIPHIRIPGPIGSVDSALNTHDGLYTTIAALSTWTSVTSPIHEVHDGVSVVGTHNANSVDHEVALCADGRTCRS